MIDIDKFIVELPFVNGLTPDLYDQLQPTIRKIQEHALERARLNAPIHDGTFRESIFVEPSLEKNAIVFDFGSSSPLPETLRLHEAEYQLGPISEAQPGTVEGGVGNKFFTRVIDYWALTWTDLIVDAMMDIIDESII